MAPEKAVAPLTSTVQNTPVPLGTDHRSVDCRLPPGVHASRIPTASPSSVRSLPSDLLLSQTQLLSNKLVLGFEEEFSVAKVHNWLRS